MLVLPRVLSVVFVSGLLVGVVLARVIPELSQQQVLGSGSEGGEGGSGYGSLRRFKATDIRLLDVLQMAQVRYDFLTLSVNPGEEKLIRDLCYVLRTTNWISGKLLRIMSIYTSLLPLHPHHHV
jgi:hypothetical protein